MTEIISQKQAALICGVDEDDPILYMLRPSIETKIKQICRWDVVRSIRTEFYPISDRGGEYDFFVDSVGGLSRTLSLRGKYVRPSGLAVYEDDDAYMGQGPNDPFSASTLLTLGTDYILELDNALISRSGILNRLSGNWCKTMGSIKVVYTAGFDETDFAYDTGAVWDARDIFEAALILAQVNYSKAKEYAINSGMGVSKAGIISEDIRGYSYSRSPTVATTTLSRMIDVPGEVLHKLQPYVHYGLNL